MRLILATLLLAFASVSQAASIALSWQDNSTNEKAFHIERRLESTGSSWEEIGQLVPTNPIATGKREWVDRTPLRGVAYVYRVRASNEFGFSGYSNEAVGTASGGPKAPTLMETREVPDLPTTNNNGLSTQ